MLAEWMCVRHQSLMVKAREWKVEMQVEWKGLVLPHVVYAAVTGSQKVLGYYAQVCNEV